MDSRDVKYGDKRALAEVGGSPITILENDHENVVDTSYLASSGFSKFYHSVLFQMVLFGA